MNLLENLKNLVASERKITADILLLLKEAEDSKLFARIGYSSVFEFCTKELGYSEGAAYRRVSAMRLLRRAESCEEKLRTGELSLSSAAKVETVFKQAKKHKIEVTEEQKENLFEAVLGCSDREAEKNIKAEAEKIGVELPRKEKIPASISEKLRALKALESHKRPYATEEELLHLALDEALAARAKKQGDIGAEGKQRYVPEKLRAAIFRRDREKCTYEDPATGRRCGTTHFLEVDHIIPLSRGGATLADNLRLLCRTHNQMV